MKIDFFWPQDEESEKNMSSFTPDFRHQFSCFTRGAHFICLGKNGQGAVICTKDRVLKQTASFTIPCAAIIDICRGSRNNEFLVLTDKEVLRYVVKS